jgi:catechol 2,3-dioxygenase-like lactoylglutathione lyase family enzyme
MDGSITHLIAGVPVSRLAVSVDWYTRFFGRPPDSRAGDEVLWDLEDHATLFIEPSSVRAGAARITFGAAGLDALLDGLSDRGIAHEDPETYPNGVRHVEIRDPDGNLLAFAEGPTS